MTHPPSPAHEDWWASLTHGGLLLAPSRVAEHFGEPLRPLEGWAEARLRRDVVRLKEGTREARSAFLDTALEDVIGLPRPGWKKGSDVGPEWSRVAMTRETLRPARVFCGPHGAVLPVFYPDGGLRTEPGYRLGVGKGRRAVARVVEWLRKANQKLALLTNGRQLRLIHAGVDHEAYCEWDAELWLQGGSVGPQVTALRALLGSRALVPLAEGKTAPLLAAIEASRQGQAELSNALGERVRLAVERIIQESAGALAALDAEGGAAGGVARRDLYVAATRIVMRCVVILFAEARELLPRGNPVYENGYGLQGLRAYLDGLAGGRAERLRHGHSAWPRLLALFSLVYHGSTHPELPIPRYGGGLFTPGDPRSPDPVLRALAALESPDNAPSDVAVHRILELLTRSAVKVRQGRGFRTVQAPVDFSDLSSEYIGILYEGLLDFELRRAPEGDAMVFLAVGDQPVLPFERLAQMTVAELGKLFEKLKKPTKADAEDEEADDDDEGEAEDADGEDHEDVVEVPEPAEAPEETRDALGVFLGEIHAWTVKAVKDARLVARPTGIRDAQAREREWERLCAARARTLIRVVPPGEWFLVRWGGTRKGSGTFYTRPQLAGPTVRRTLEPLVSDEAGAPRTPEEILRLKVCDPAMGSGSFLIAALRTLTASLLASLHHHGRIEAHGGGCHIRLADGLPATHPSQESLPMPPGDPDFEERLLARLKRHVVERCLYGVDLDPLAVELARLSLWVETMDPYLPFGFLDHKLRCGNSLVGCWLDRLDTYPIKAWEREGGDKQHTLFVHHFREVPAKGKHVAKRAGDKWTWAIKQRREEILGEARALAAERRTPRQLTILIEGRDSAALHAEALEAFQELHDIIPVFEAERRAQVYREKVLGNPALVRLREALDAWCALWFWPGDALSHAPGPLAFLKPEAWSAETRAIVHEVAASQRFFHWEIEFPDVFTGPESGFDAVVGNPPWETQKPNSMEFFSNHDPLYRTYTKQQALARQKELFAALEDIELGWVRYSARLKALSSWTKLASESEAASPGRAFADPEHPFRYQGSADINSYKMFLELAHALLRRGGGLGLLCPSGLYTDNGSRALRQLFLERSAWTHLYAFQNERFVFESIDHRFKMCVVHVRKARADGVLLTRFRLGPGDSPETHELVDDLTDASAYLPLPAERIRRFSPTSGSILEIRSRRDLDVLEKLYANGVLLGDQGPAGWGIRYAREFDMTNDSKLFPPRPKWEADGYKPDEYGHWLKGKWRAGDSQLEDGGRDWDLVRSADGQEVIGVDEIAGVALPLYQGRMINNLDFCASGWVSGTGLSAAWEPVPWEAKRIRPQFLLGLEDARSSGATLETKAVFRDIARTTDERTMIPAFVPPFPCGNVLGVLNTKHNPAVLLASAAAFITDWSLRQRMGGTHLNWYILEELGVLGPQSHGALAAIVSGLSLVSSVFARTSLRTRGATSTVAWRKSWAITPHERLRLRAMLDALVARAYGLSRDDFVWILRECDLPVNSLSDMTTSRSLNPKGFWRIDRDLPPELRHTVLSLVAFDAVQRDGQDAFLAGDGWQLPETLRLADHGLGHDARAREPQPVASVLGPRFLPWQLEQSVDESWEECRRHVELISRIIPTPGATSALPSPPRDLFGTVVAPRSLRRK